MTLRIVGAGVGRTGTHSLKVALEQLLGGKCHHMMEVFPNLELAEPFKQINGFTAAIDGKPTDWALLLDGFNAMVDFPGSLFWRELAAANPDAPVLLSTRDAKGWYKSASNTIFLALTNGPPELTDWMAAMRRCLADRFSADFDNEAAMIDAYEQHNAAVRTEVPAARLIDWTPGDGWGPICAALDVAVPSTPFPVTNTTDEFREMTGMPPLA